MLGIGTGFFGKLSNIQDENRKQENEMLMEDYKQFNEALKIYRATKKEQETLNNKARAVAMQISGDPRDAKAFQIARQALISGIDPTDPINFAKIKGQYDGFKVKDSVTPAAAPKPIMQAPGLGGAPAAPNAHPAAPGTPQEILQQAPDAALNTPAPQQAAPQGSGFFDKKNMANMVLGKSSPEVLQQRSTDNIAARTGFTADQVRNIRMGNDTGVEKFEPTEATAPIDPKQGIMMKVAMEAAAKGHVQPQFWQAFMAGDYSGATPYITDDAARHRYKMAEIDAQGKNQIEAAKISAHGAESRNTQIMLNEAYQKLGIVRTAVTNSPEVKAKYAAQFPGLNINDPDVIDWIAHRELQRQDPAAHARVIAGVDNKEPKGTDAMLDKRLGTAPPGYKPNKPGEKPTTPTNPYENPTSSTGNKEELAKASAEYIKSLPSTSPNKTKLQDEFRKKFGNNLYIKHFSPDIPKKEPPKREENDVPLSDAG